MEEEGERERRIALLATSFRSRLISGVQQQQVHRAITCWLCETMAVFLPCEWSELSRVSSVRILQLFAANGNVWKTFEHRLGKKINKYANFLAIEKKFYLFFFRIFLGSWLTLLDISDYFKFAINRFVYFWFFLRRMNVIR